MARITNTPLVPGAALTAAQLNGKFGDIETATTTGLDDENVRQEGIDYLQFEVETSSGKAGTILRNTGFTNNGVGTTGTPYTSVDPADPAGSALPHGTGAVLSFGTGGQQLSVNDMLRVHWHTWVSDWTFTGGLFTGGTLDMPCWVIWLEWDITSNALANYEAVPGQTAFTDTAGAGEQMGLCSEMAATMVIPHGYHYLLATVVTEREHDDLQLRRSFNYVNETGNAITVYGLRLVIDGLYHPEYSANTGLVNALVKPAAGGGSWAGEEVDIASITLGALFQRTR